ncbi:MAG: hypothetical protein R3E66_10685 [bacterium]
MGKATHIAAALACIGLASAVASAHVIPIERTLMVTAHADKLEVLAIYSEPPGVRTERLLALYDLNRDGRLTGKELPLATPELAERAFMGIRITVDGEVANNSAVEANCKREANKGLSCALYLTVAAKLPERVEVALVNRQGVLTTPTQINAAEGVSADQATINGEPVEAGAVVRLAPGDALRVRFNHTPVANPAPLK